MDRGPKYAIHMACGLSHWKPSGSTLFMSENSMPTGRADTSRVPPVQLFQVLSRIQRLYLRTFNRSFTTRKYLVKSAYLRVVQQKKIHCCADGGSKPLPALDVGNQQEWHSCSRVHYEGALARQDAIAKSERAAIVYLTLIVPFMPAPRCGSQ
jgi:hypothetical protein